MGTNILKKIIAFLLIASMLLLSGCASMSKPQVGSHGEQLVWIGVMKIHGGETQPDSNVASIGAQVASMGTSSPVQAGLVGGLLSVALSMGGSNKVEPRLQILYWPTANTSAGFSYPQIYRKPWPGSSELKAKSWAILSSDEKGPLLLPCGGCEPVKQSD